MSPNITGIRNADHLASMDLAVSAWKFAEEHLALEGNYIVKIFQGGQEEEGMWSLRDQVLIYRI